MRYGSLGIAGICLAIAVGGSACGTQEKTPVTGTPAGVDTPAGSPASTSPTPIGKTQPASDTDFDPRNFNHSTRITNRYLPMTPGAQFLWKGHAYDDGEKVSRAIEFTVTDLTKMIDGVRTVVARDRDFTEGAAEEVELTFYAQDDFGTVWYFGEYSEEYDDQRIVKSPAWLAGLHGAKPGIMMQADPRTGTPDYAEGWGGDLHWNDRARVKDVGVKNCVPTGCYSDVTVIDEFNPDEPGQHQLKYYAPNVGGIRTGYSGKNEVEREELTLESRIDLDPKALADLRDDVLDEENRAYRRSPDKYGKTARMEER